MSTEVIRIRLTHLPSVRDLEYFALRYLTVNGVYETPLLVAQDLIEFGYAEHVDGTATSTDIEPFDVPDDND